MGTRILAKDIADADVVDAAELGSSGTTTYRTADPVSSTVSSTKRILFSGSVDLVNGDDPVEAGDKVTITGSVAAGTYTVATVVGPQIVAVVEAIVDSSGGTADFVFQAGANRVGFNPSGMAQTAQTQLQGVLSDLDLVLTRGPVWVVRSLPADITVPAGQTRLHRDTIVPDGVTIFISNTGEFYIL